MSTAATETVAVVAFDGISPFHLSVPCMVFGEDRTEAGAPRFRVQVCAPEPGELRTNAGFSLVVPHGLEAIRRARIVVVPSWRDDCSAAPPELVRALQAAHRRGATVVGLCLGAFVLAEAGLLDGRPATTHWKLAPAFARQYPKVKLQPEVLYVEDGNVLTSAGTAAGIDCCLHLLRVRYGAETANRAARRMVVAPHRQGGQAQYIEQPVPATAERDRLAPLLEWLGRHLDRPHELDDLARRALMSRRNFTRRFRESTGTTVGQWMQNQRLALAQRLLETTDHPVERVATGAGFGSAVSLRKHFLSAFKVSPTAYRQQFSRAGID
ncbi:MULTISPECIES: GlxA family transcriptional regulator [Variovorax]|uniref:Transcriptional regulator GlxA family with amidase domain n=1 Tax=Variovorax guangxiensis TaxID=1775474 RepID=A0A840G286_9BURK|nr:helix-turn-helix domain-containing protein [Variovorax guangxiensis]MBB4222998.1 transcriptional regulator GlxA family with amidase domain [Variovorax guangxiensis]